MKIKNFLLSLCYAILFLFTQALSTVLCQRGPGHSIDAWLKTLFPEASPHLTMTYFVSLGLLFCIFLSILFLNRKLNLETRFEKILFFAIPGVLVLSSFAFSPTKSIDIFSYAAHGYLSVESPANAYLVGAREVVKTEFGKDLLSLGWSPDHGASPYGPLWTNLEYLAVFLSGGSAVVSVLIFKLIAIFSFVGSTALIWKLSDRIAPRRKLLATTAFLWNPFFMGEIAFEGHNDGIMIFFVLLAIYALTLRKISGAIVSLTLSILTKYLPVLLLPTFVRCLWSQNASSPEEKRKMWKALSIGLAGSIGAALLLYSPFGFKQEIFGAVRNSSAGVSFVIRFLAPLLARMGLQEAAMALPFLFKAILLYLVLRPLRRKLTVQNLLTEASFIFGFYFFFVSPAYWCWYLSLPAALALLVPGRGSMIFVLGASFLSVLSSPLWHMGVMNIIPPPQMFLWHQILSVRLIAPLFLLYLFFSFREKQYAA